MKILLTNDDGYYARGIKSLASIMCHFGNVTVIAPKFHQSGMGMAVSIGMKPIAYKELGERDGVKWSYLDATPASCVKFGLNCLDLAPDIVVCGINHGSNASSAACYSGTLGAAAEAALNGIPAIGVSLDSTRPDADFSAVEKFFPDIFASLSSNQPSRRGLYYNVNFPAIPAGEIKGVRAAEMGMGRWDREFVTWESGIARHEGLREFLGGASEPQKEEGETIYMMTGTYIDSPDNTPLSDNHLIAEGYISVVAHNIASGDSMENERLRTLSIDKDFH